MGYNTAETMNGRTVTEGFMCERCKFYRAEPKLLLQGVIADSNARVSSKKTVLLGPCPDSEYKPKLQCPPHDPNCGCHGPIMTKGMVGWAGGGGGPDFFINTHAEPVDWWEHQHTVWGEVRDETSFGLVERVYGLPAKGKGMRMLDEAIEFSLELF
jgi:cyclophilin family peptidyl-prolyl cis-trans isomerase